MTDDYLYNWGEEALRARRNNQKNNAPTTNLSAKLAVIGSALASVGDVISTIAAVLALEEAATSDVQQQQQEKNQNNQLQMMQKQIDDLKSELLKLRDSTNYVAKK